MPPVVNARVVVLPGMTIEKAIKQLRKACEKEGVLRDIRRKQYYLKPSELERLRKARLRKKHLRKMRKFGAQF